MRVDVQDITIPIGDIELEGSLAVPAGVTGLVMFAHGSGSSRHSPRNHHVASLLHEHFDVEMLAERLVGATDSVVACGRSRGLPIG